MKKPTLQQFKHFSRQNATLAAAVIKAQAFARSERARVDAYIAPIFAAHDFRDSDGAPITNPQSLYLCQEEADVARFFRQCDVAHREHGFAGPIGHCPALVAGHDQIRAETALLKAAGELFDVDFACAHGDLRQHALSLLLEQLNQKAA